MKTNKPVLTLPEATAQAWEIVVFLKLPWLFPLGLMTFVAVLDVSVLYLLGSALSIWLSGNPSPSGSSILGINLDDLSLLRLALFLIALGFLRFCSSLFKEWYLNDIWRRGLVRMRNYVVESYFYAFSKSSSSSRKSLDFDVQSMLTGTEKFFDQFLLPLYRIIGDSIALACILGMIFFFYFWATLLTLSAASIFGFVGYLVLKMALGDKGQTVIFSEKTLLQKINDLVNGWREIVLYDAKSEFTAQFKHASSKYSSDHASFRILSGVPNLLFEFVAILFVVGIGVLVSLSPENFGKENDIGGVYFFALSLVRVLPIIRDISKTSIRIKFFGYLMKQIVAFIRIYKEGEKREFGSTLEPLVSEKQKDGQAGGVKEISVEDLGLTLDGVEIFKGVEFKVKRGETLGIFGPSGSGKSKLIDVLCGFEAQSSGNIFIDGKSQDLRSSPASLALCGQRTFLMNTSIYENIALGGCQTFGKTAETKVQLAAQACFCDEFVDLQSSEAMHEKVSVESGRLSGGQIQRIGLARAYLSEADVVFLDEATANLDPKLRENIMQTFVSNSADKILIFVSHRLDDRQYCDVILEM